MQYMVCNGSNVVFVTAWCSAMGAKWEMKPIFMGAFAYHFCLNYIIQGSFHRVVGTGDGIG